MPGLECGSLSATSCFVKTVHLHVAMFIFSLHHCSKKVLPQSAVCGSLLWPHKDWQAVAAKLSQAWMALGLSSLCLKLSRRRASMAKHLRCRQCVANKDEPQGQVLHPSYWSCTCCQASYPIHRCLSWHVHCRIDYIVVSWVYFFGSTEGLVFCWLVGPWSWEGCCHPTSCHGPWIEDSLLANGSAWTPGIPTFFLYVQAKRHPWNLL